MHETDRRELHLWAHETFGHAELGHRGRTKRLIQMATRLACAPAGTVTGAFTRYAEQEGAFRWLSNASFSVDALVAAASRATFERCRDRAFCVIDGSSLTVTDRLCVREVGGVGSWSSGARGVHVLSALVLDEHGTPVGIGGAHYWARTHRGRARGKRHKSLQTETAHVMTLLESVEQTRTDAAGDVHLHYVMDRGFDAWPVFQWAEHHGCTLTVRARGDRRVLAGTHTEKRLLRQVLKRANIVTDRLIEVPPRHGQPGRLAALHVRAARVTLILPVGRKRRQHVAVNAIAVREVGRRADALEWLLLTTAAIASKQGVEEIVDAYALRWRIEEVHRVWKKGWCNVERTQLRSLGGLCKWATLHLVVAARATRLTYLARTQPELPATDEFERDEIDAVLLHQAKRTKYRQGDTPPLAEVVRLIGMLGGHSGKPSAGSPGAAVLARGLERVAVASETLRLLRTSDE